MFEKPEVWKHKQRPTKSNIFGKHQSLRWIILDFCVSKSIGFPYTFRKEREFTMVKSWWISKSNKISRKGSPAPLNIPTPTLAPDRSGPVAWVSGPGFLASWFLGFKHLLCFQTIFVTYYQIVHFMFFYSYWCPLQDFQKNIGRIFIMFWCPSFPKSSKCWISPKRFVEIKFSKHRLCFF